MVSAGDLLTLYVGLELQSLAAYVLASFQRTDARSAEAGLKYFVLGALASGILLYGISLLYGFTGTTSFDGIASALGPTGSRRGELFGLVFVLAGLAFKISGGAVPHVDARRLRGRADPGHRLLRLARPRSRRWRCSSGSRSRRWGRRPTSWRQIVIFAALASTVLGGVAAIGQTQHQAPARLQLDQQCRLRPGRPRRRHAARASPRCCSTWRSMSR